MASRWGLWLPSEGRGPPLPCAGRGGALHSVDPDSAALGTRPELRSQTRIPALVQTQHPPSPPNPSLLAPGVGLAQPGPRPAIRGRRPSHLPPGPRSFELHQVGSPAARAAPTPRPHPPAPGTVPTAPRGSRRDEPGRGSATPATVGVRGAAPQSPGTGSCARGSPYPRARPSEPLDAPGPFCLGLCGPRPGPLPGRSRVLPGPLAGPCPPAALLPCGELGALGRALGGPRAARPGRAAGNARRPSPARSGGRREGAGGREEEERGGRREEGARHGGRRKTRAGSARAGAGAPRTRVPAGTRAARSGAQHAEKGLRRQPQVGRLGSLT